MKKKFVIIVLSLLLSYGISTANDLINLTRFDNKAFYVSKSDIRRNLTNYRTGDYITLTVMVVFLTLEESQKYEKRNPCWKMNSNNYKYVLQEYQFSFKTLQGMMMSTNGYDKFDNFLCGGETRTPLRIKDPFFDKIKKLFDDADRKEKKEPW